MIKVQLIHPQAKVPTCAHPGEDLCWDLYAVEETVLLSNRPAKVPIGIKVEPPEGYGLLIRPRSGMSARGVLLGGGEIDFGYRGELLVLLTLLPDPCEGDRLYVIGAGDRVAQMRLEPIRTAEEWVVVDSLGESARGEDGFGSTGK